MKKKQEMVETLRTREYKLYLAMINKQLEMEEVYADGYSDDTVKTYHSVFCDMRAEWVVYYQLLKEFGIKEIRDDQFVFDLNMKILHYQKERGYYDGKKFEWEA